MTTLRHGSRGPSVERLQRDLARRGHALEPDGVFGPATEAAVRRFQRERGLVIDGIAGPKTRHALQRGERHPKALCQADLVDAAEQLEVELAAVMAINEVESRGTGFHHGGPRHNAPVILFERHIMRRRLIHHEISPVEHQRRHPGLVNDRPGGYIGGPEEHRRLELAAEIHAGAAIESCSWGLFQIMGFHWERLGYANASAFQEAMRAGEAEQLAAFVRFIERDRALHAALKRHDWRDLARRYNGPAFERNDYDTKLQSAHRRHARALETAA
ncbi:MAG: N-acetylmuramidase domain-containing protein [Phycisphaeraceae bacterium]